jgi:hypothetical protein
MLSMEAPPNGTPVRYDSTGGGSPGAVALTLPTTGWPVALGSTAEVSFIFTGASLTAPGRIGGRYGGSLGDAHRAAQSAPRRQHGDQRVPLAHRPRRHRLRRRGPVVHERRLRRQVCRDDLLDLAHGDRRDLLPAQRHAVRIRRHGTRVLRGHVHQRRALRLQPPVHSGQPPLRGVVERRLQRLVVRRQQRRRQLGVELRGLVHPERGHVHRRRGRVLHHLLAEQPAHVPVTA